MGKIFIYEIFLDGMLVINSGDMKFKTEEEAREDVNKFISYILKDDAMYEDNTAEDFDIIISEVTEDDFSRGW